jgi:hypothetical protein
MIFLSQIDAETKKALQEAGFSELAIREMAQEQAPCNAAYGPNNSASSTRRVGTSVPVINDVEADESGSSGGQNDFKARAPSRLEEEELQLALALSRSEAEDKH